MSLESELQQTTRFQRLTHTASCASTQAMAEEDSSPGWSVFWSDHQSAGRGREGRSWVDSPAQDIAVTFRVSDLKLRNPTHLAAAVPVAAIESIAAIVPETRIKWPNDLLLHGRKLCGVLIDSHPRLQDTYCIGVGMNINRSSFPRELTEQSTSLALATGREFDRSERVLSLAREIDRVVSLIEAGDLTPLAEVFSARLGLSGEPVTATTADQAITGTLTDLDLERAVLDDAKVIPLAHLRGLKPA